MVGASAPGPMTHKVADGNSKKNGSTNQNGCSVKVQKVAKLRESSQARRQRSKAEQGSRSNRSPVEPGRWQKQINE